MTADMARLNQDIALRNNLEAMRRNVLAGKDSLDLLGRHSGAGSGFQDKVDKVCGDFLTTAKIDHQAYDQLRKIYGMARTGQITSERELHSQSQIFANTLKAGVENTAREVVTGTDSEGKISYKSMAVRALAAVLSKGASERIYTPASSVYTMKDYVEASGDSVGEGFQQTAKDVVKGELFGRIFGQGSQAAGRQLGKAVTRTGQAVSQHFPNASRVITKNSPSTARSSAESWPIACRIKS